MSPGHPLLRPRLIVEVLDIARYLVSDSSVKIIGHKTNTDICERLAIEPQQAGECAYQDGPERKMTSSTLE
jgi:hypothetical protein